MLIARASALLSLLSMTALVSPGDARADGGDAVLADSLYAEGKQLFEKKEYAAACPKLAESDRLDPAGGTVLMLAECYEGEGKIASASAAYGQALARAVRDRRKDREKEARSRLEALQSSVPRVVLDVPDAVRAIPGLVVKRAGADVPSVSFGIEVLTDPGRVEISAEAPGHARFETSIDLRIGETRHVRVGPLVPISASKRPPPKAAPLSIAVPVSITLGAVGIASIVVGTFFGLGAISDAEVVNERCHHAPTCADREAVDLANTANDEANAANVLLPLGAAMLASGIIVIAVMGPHERGGATVTVEAHAGAAPGLSLRAAF